MSQKPYMWIVKSSRYDQLIVAATLSLLMLSGCSTLPDKTPLLTPPASAMQKAKPLPKVEHKAINATDSEGRQLTDVGLLELVQSDIEVSKLYHDLATNHDALVDYVHGLIEEQNRNLNK